MYLKNTKRYMRLTRLRKKTKKYTNKKKKVHFGGGCGASKTQWRTIVDEDELSTIKRLKQNSRGRGRGRPRHRPISLDDAICGDFNFMYDFHRNLIVYTPYNSTRVVPFLGKKFVISNNYACEIGLENYDQLPNASDTLKRDYESLLGKILFQNQMDKKGSIEGELAYIHYDMISLPDEIHTPLVVDSLGIISSVHPSCTHVTEGISPEMVNIFCKHVLKNPDEYPMYHTTHRDYGMLTIEDIHTIISRIPRGVVPEPYSDRRSGSDSDSGSRRQLVSRRP
jgi:hypothetical protein